VSSERKKGPDEEREVWEAYRRAFFGEEKSPDEPTTWEAYRTAFRKAWPTYSDAIQATGTYADAFLDLYGDALDSDQIRKLEEIRGLAAATPEVSEEKGWQLVAGQLRKLTDIGMQSVARQKARERKEDWRYWLALGVAIVVGLLSLIVQLITWWLGR